MSAGGMPHRSADGGGQIGLFHHAGRQHGVLPEGTGQGNNKRDVCNTLVKAGAFMGKPMVAEHFTVIGIENNDGVFPAAPLRPVRQ